MCMALANADVNFLRGKYLYRELPEDYSLFYLLDQKSVGGVIAIFTLHSNQSATEIKILANTKHCREVIAWN